MNTKYLIFFLVLSRNTQKDRLYLDTNTDLGRMSISQNTEGNYRSKATMRLSLVLKLMKSPLCCADRICT